MANPSIYARRPDKAKPYYLVTFETLADRTRWLLRNGFTMDPLEHITARWTCTHNGSDFTHWLEMVPYATELSCNPRALCLRVYLHAYNQHTKPDKPKERASSKPKRDSLGTFGSPPPSPPEPDPEPYFRYSET